MHSDSDSTSRTSPTIVAARPAELPEPSRWHTGPYQSENHWYHGVFLLLCVSIVLLAATLQIRDDQRVLFLGIQPLPDVCMFRRLFGVGCPGCGMTHSFISIGHLEFVDAWRYHPVGPLLFVLVLLQIPYRAAQLWRLRTLRGPLCWPWAGGLLWLIAILLVLQWVLRPFWG